MNPLEDLSSTCATITNGYHLDRLWKFQHYPFAGASTEKFHHGLDVAMSSLQMWNMVGGSLRCWNFIICHISSVGSLTATQVHYLPVGGYWTAMLPRIFAQSHPKVRVQFMQICILLWATAPPESRTKIFDSPKRGTFWTGLLLQFLPERQYKTTFCRFSFCAGCNANSVIVLLNKQRHVQWIMVHFRFHSHALSFSNESGIIRNLII